MQYKLAIAIAELDEAVEFIMDLLDCSPEEMFEKVAERAPSFIEYVKAMKKPPKNTLEFVGAFGIWIASTLYSKHGHAWNEATKVYWNSDLAKETGTRIKVKTQITQILKDAGFQ